MRLTRKQVKKLKCLALLDLAETNELAAKEIRERAAKWSTCAIGEQANKLGVTPDVLYSSDPEDSGSFFNTTKLRDLGIRFAGEVELGLYKEATQTYSIIEKRVEKLFGTKVKQERLGLA